MPSGFQEKWSFAAAGDGHQGRAERTIWNACPIACVEEAQAVEIVNAGPCTPNRIQMWLAPALFMLSGMVSG